MSQEERERERDHVGGEASNSYYVTCAIINNSITFFLYFPEFLVCLSCICVSVQVCACVGVYGCVWVCMCK